MERETVEVMTTVFGPSETKAICISKWLDKLLNLLRTWPGLSLPWSEADMPRFCAQGFDLVVAFDREMRVRNLRCFPGGNCDHDEYWKAHSGDEVYPWQGDVKCPFVAADIIRYHVEAQVSAWNTDPKMRSDDRQIRQHIETLLERVAKGVADEFWEAEPEDDKNSEQEQSPERSVGRFGELVMKTVHAEVQQRVGPIASVEEWNAAVHEVANRIFFSDEANELMDVLIAEDEDATAEERAS